MLLSNLELPKLTMPAGRKTHREVVAQHVGLSPAFAGIRSVTPRQIRAARAFVGWSREMLAKKARVHPQTIVWLESGNTCLPTTIYKIHRALQRAGIVFIDEGSASSDGGPGVRLSGKPRNR